MYHILSHAAVQNSGLFSNSSFFVVYALNIIIFKTIITEKYRILNGRYIHNSQILKTASPLRSAIDRVCSVVHEMINVILLETLKRSQDNSAIW